mgnify:CR=1 FL=1
MAEFVVGEATTVSVPPTILTTSYPGTVLLALVDAVQLRVTEFEVTPEATGVPGVVGPVVVDPG